MSAFTGVISSCDIDTVVTGRLLCPAATCRVARRDPHRHAADSLACWLLVIGASISLRVSGHYIAGGSAPGEVGRILQPVDIGHVSGVGDAVQMEVINAAVIGEATHVCLIKFKCR